MSNHKQYQVRYTGTFGNSLHSTHSDWEQAQKAKVAAQQVAIKNGEKKVASSFEIV